MILSNTIIKFIELYQKSEILSILFNALALTFLINHDSYDIPITPSSQRPIPLVAHTKSPHSQQNSPEPEYAGTLART